MELMSIPIPLKKNEITDRTVGRLVAYRRLLQQMQAQDVTLLSSKLMGEMLGIKSSQVRKDLSYLGEFGKRGVGYDVERLLSDLTAILAPFERWRIGLIGLGRLGEALLEHGAFRSDEYEIVATFDIADDKVGHSFSGRPCFHSDVLVERIQVMNIGVLMVTVPPSVAQSLVDVALTTGMIQGILNFSPVSLSVPEKVELIDVDISVELEKLLFRLKFNEQQRRQQKSLADDMVQYR